MGARISQRAQGVQNRWPVGATLMRGTTVVDDTLRFFMPISDGLGHVAWQFTVPSVVPATGEWRLDCPILTEFVEQDFGVAIIGGAVHPVHLAAGNITTPGLIAAGSKVTIRGTVTV